MADRASAAAQVFAALWDAQFERMYEYLRATAARSTNVGQNGRQRARRRRPPADSEAGAQIGVSTAFDMLSKVLRCAIYKSATSSLLAYLQGAESTELPKACVACRVPRRAAPRRACR